jgi:predicted nucleic acid-binding protein
MNYALDTNIVSYLLKKKVPYTEKAREERKKGTIFFFPPMVYYETKRWLMRNRSQHKTQVFETMYADDDIEGISKDDLEAAARLYTELGEKGIVIDDADILIAVYCLKHDYTLVTNNEKHFEDIKGLRIVTWTA